LRKVIIPEVVLGELTNNINFQMEAIQVKECPVIHAKLEKMADLSVAKEKMGKSNRNIF